MDAKTSTAEEFDRRFDDGEDMADYVDWDSGRSPDVMPKRVNIDFPLWMVMKLDREAKRRGISRQALIKVWVSDRLDAAA
jgi:CopG antitoxin of type II toxin-antitoxin system